MTDEVSVKNTKNEILEAYHEALEQLKTAKKASKQEIKVVEEKKETISKAVSHSTDAIVQNIAILKLSLVRSLEDIEEQLLVSHKQLMTLQQAIELQSKELSDLHEIKFNADSLGALLQAQKEKTMSFDKEMKERSFKFDQEMAEKRTLWKKEQVNLSCLKKIMSSKRKNPVNAKKMNIFINVN
ncbi:MAG: hypothetical protein H0T84_13345 [Tatlockia sp.]|nr:hypothetical protein [Tatlockia sp.]